MRIHWSIHTIPELSGFSKEERVHIWRRHSFRLSRSLSAWCSLAIFLLVMLLVWGAFLRAAPLVSSDYMDPESARVIGTLIGLPVAMILGALVYYVLFI